MTTTEKKHKDDGGEQGQQLRPSVDMQTHNGIRAAGGLYVVINQLNTCLACTLLH